jgi:hypothetical protein
VAVSLLFGLLLMFPLDQVALEGAGVDGAVELRRMGAVGLALGATVGAWLEYWLLRHMLTRRIGEHGAHRPVVATAVVAGVAGAAAAVLAKLVLGSITPLRSGLVEALVGRDSWAFAPLLAAGTALVFGVSYLAMASALGLGTPLRKLLRR